MGAAVALVVTGLVVGAPANAGVGPSQWCEETWPAGTTNRVRLLNSGAYAAVSYGVPTATPPTDFSVNLCYSDRPYGTPTIAAGGMIHLRFSKIGPNTYEVYLKCYGDSTTAGTTGCEDNVVTTTTVHTSPGVGGSTSAFIRVESTTLVIGTTGADSGTTSTRSGSNPEVTYGSTCATVHGIPLTGSCTGKAIEANAANGDVTPAVGGTTGTCLIWAGSSCLIFQPRAGVVLFNDTANDTQVTILGVPLVTDPGTYQCYGSC